jgi:hypothetical protein
MFGHYRVVLIASFIFASASHAAPAPGWLNRSKTLGHELTYAELHARQASNKIRSAAQSVPASQSTGSATLCTIAEPGDTCDGLADDFGVSLSYFLAANPSVDSACDNLLAGVEYCL